jgi:tripartite-type tricarboxylate transporter receptor subunit TctC
MQRKDFLLTTTALLLASAFPITGSARAAYPTRPINMIVAFGAGGGTDIIARMIVPYIQRYLGNNATIVVHNRTGAGGGIGFTELASAPPDGYTIGFVNTPPVLTIPIQRSARFTWRSFDLLGNVIDDPGNFSVHADTPIRNLAELAAHARANPGTVSVGTSGIGSDDHLAMLLFQRTAGVQLLHVPFRGGADVHRAIAGKQVTVAAVNIGEALQFARGGTPLRHLGVMAASRTALAPDLPTFKEQGFDIVLSSLRGMAAPKGLPPAVRALLAAAIQKAAADPQFQAQAVNAFAPLRYLSPTDFEVELRDAEAGFRRLWAETPWGE